MVIRLIILLFIPVVGIMFGFRRNHFMEVSISNKKLVKKNTRRLQKSHKLIHNTDMMTMHEVFFLFKCIEKGGHKAQNAMTFELAHLPN